MKALSILFAFIALGAGIKAAWDWHASANVAIDPAIHKMEDGEEAFRLIEWVENVNSVTSKVSRLNRSAALWTAASVFSSALSAVGGALASN